MATTHLGRVYGFGHSEYNQMATVGVLLFFSSFPSSFSSSFSLRLHDYFISLPISPTHKLTQTPSLPHTFPLTYPPSHTHSTPSLSHTLPPTYLPSHIPSLSHTLPLIPTQPPPSHILTQVGDNVDSYHYYVPRPIAIKKDPGCTGSEGKLALNEDDTKAKANDKDKGKGDAYIVRCHCGFNFTVAIDNEGEAYPILSYPNHPPCSKHAPCSMLLP